MLYSRATPMTIVTLILWTHDFFCAALFFAHRAFCAAMIAARPALDIP